MKTLPLLFTSGLMLGTMSATAYAAELPVMLMVRRLFTWTRLVAVSTHSMAWFMAG